MLPVSIVIPTYKEVNNLAALLAEIHSIAFNGRQFEVILVDDNSQDGSLELINKLHSTYPTTRMIIHEGQRGLSRSVMYGCTKAAYPLIVSMDADLSHPVSIIPAMLQYIESGQAEMVMGSRYVPGGSVEEKWPLRRKLISKLCALATKSLLRLSVNDPLSGFFAIHQSTLQRGKITNPSGWKIALEIMVKCHVSKIIEIPIHFQDRRFGKSKLNARVGAAFIKQLSELAYFQYIG
jgi:dolichol-phosphate mannosyltransferase